MSQFPHLDPVPRPSRGQVSAGAAGAEFGAGCARSLGEQEGIRHRAWDQGPITHPHPIKSGLNEALAH